MISLFPEEKINNKLVYNFQKDINLILNDFKCNYIDILSNKNKTEAALFCYLDNFIINNIFNYYIKDYVITINQCQTKFEISIKLFINFKEIEYKFNLNIDIDDIINHYERKAYYTIKELFKKYKL